MTTGSNAHDSTAFRRSGLARLFQQHRIPGGYFLCGDAAYRGNAGVVAPFTGSFAPGTLHDTYNFIHSSHRTAIERCFGCLVRRWGILWRPLKFPHGANVAIVFALCRLHNICMLRRNPQSGMRRHRDDEGDQPLTDGAVVNDLCPVYSSSIDGTAEEREAVREAHDLRRMIAQRLHANGCIRPII